MKGFIALDAHPVGCARQVASAVEELQPSESRSLPTPGPVVVLGASGGYGLPAAIAAAFRYDAPVIGVCLERPPQRGRTATAGWYNVVALAREAERRQRRITVLNADCFADATKQQVTDELAALGPPSLLIYSVAAPVRTDPASGVTYRSVLKTVGEPFSTKTVKMDTGEITETTLDPATDEEIDATVRVMGGDDWARWVDALSSASLIADGFRTVAFDYVGPEATHAIYRSGTIGAAKRHLEATAKQLDAKLSQRGGGAWASVNAAAVTQSSTAIPAVPLYLSLLLAAAPHFETPTEQMRRLFDEHLAKASPALDAEGRIRLDDWELTPQLQGDIARRWDTVTTDTFNAVGDFDSFQRRFRQLFGFDVPGINYDASVDIDLPWP
jgi:enoyl-[acyl-carrier protein] reductase / trans-2-enoyl-CoA reductase (NAD+)